MTHQNAEQQMAVERYLLGELTDESREHFEEHLFDCELCTTDLKLGILFLDAAKAEMRGAPRTVAAPMRRSPLAWLWSPQLLAPALAACLAIVVYESAVLLPRARMDLAAVDTPAVVAPLTLANAGARGAATLPQIVAPRKGFYLLSVDIPTVAHATGYRCALYAADGSEVWHLLVTPEQIHDAVTLQVPVSSAQPGVQELRVQSVSPDGGTLVRLASYKYGLIFK